MGRAHLSLPIAGLLPRREARQRGVAAVEMALVTPLLFGIAGAIITFGLAIQARAQMIEMTHQAVRMCAATLPSSVSGVRSCVDNHLNNQLPTARLVCTASVVPAVVQILPVTIPYRWQIYGVTGKLTCAFTKLGVPLTRLLPGGAPAAITISAQSTSSFIPGSN